MENTKGKKPSFFARMYNRLHVLSSSLRPTEKAVLYIAAIIFLFTGASLFTTINNKYSVELPVHGGTYTEGVVGYARFINPILSYTDADRDMTALLYSGLLRPSADGKLMLDLAESWNISGDGLTYTFILKPNLTFHDGTPLTTDDVAFTIEKAVDPAVKSPKASNWAGVKIEKINNREIHFVLPKPYAPFLSNLTLGIIPQHIWKGVDVTNFDVSTQNREPIGSGPFMIKKTYISTDGLYESYDLVPFTTYTLGNAYIDHLIVRFYKNETDAVSAYKNGTIQAVGGISPENATMLATQGYTVLHTPLPRIFGLFFNQSAAPVLLNKEVRQALDISIDREALIQKVLRGWGVPATGPIPQNTASHTSVAQVASSTVDSRILAAKALLEKAGWKIGQDGVYIRVQKTGKTTGTERLAFTISTSNIDELKQTAQILKDTWRQIGVDVTVQLFETSDLTSKVIRPRHYDALLFGNVVGRDTDLFPFWHSSERNDPGLNVALYTNLTADKALETIRSTSDESKRADAFATFTAQVQSDIPALFLYSPDYIYATQDYVHNLTLSDITYPSERFKNIYKWYTETEEVWKIFAPNTQ